MRLRLLNAVVLAENSAKLRDWYIEALGLELQQEWTEKYHYAELVKDGRLVVGIADAREMKVEPGERRRQAVAAQLDVEDLKGLLEQVKAAGGEVQAEQERTLPGAVDWSGHAAHPRVRSLATTTLPRPGRRGSGSAGRRSRPEAPCALPARRGPRRRERGPDRDRRSAWPAPAGSRPGRD
jgi:predicted enzyme related to lactoylglutathione lyase